MVGIVDDSEVKLHKYEWLRKRSSVLEGRLRWVSCRTLESQMAVSPVVSRKGLHFFACFCFQR